MIVWVLETGCYDGRLISGIFSTAEKAMAAWPVRQDMRRTQPLGITPIEWVQKADDWWLLEGASWDDTATVIAYEVDKVLS